MYPKLAKAYPTNKLPDLRVSLFVAGMTGGELIRRSLLNAQSHSVIDHIHYMELWTGEGLAANSHPCRNKTLVYWLHTVMAGLLKQMSQV